MENIIRASKITAMVLIMCVAAFVIHVIQICIIPEEIAVMNPLISGFLHQGAEHLFLNMIVLFVSMLHPINRKSNYKSIYIITTIISLIYLPISILGITSFAIGLSGTCYFFLTRATINCGWIGKAIILILLISETSSLFSEDSTAHGVHLIGIILGFISLQIWGQQKSPDIPGFFEI